MCERKKVGSIKLTGLKRDKASTFNTTSNLNQINFHFRKLMGKLLDLQTCDYLADIVE
mgnify:FL=1|jgi:hypothetical protein